MKLSREVRIARPPADVFAFVSEPRNLPAWQRAVSEVRRDDGPVAAGTRFVEVRSFVGKRFESAVEVVELEDDRLFTIRVVSGPVPVTVRHVFEPADAGTVTRLTLTAEAKPHGLLRLGAGVMAKAAEHDAEVGLTRLKTLLEAGG